MRTFLAKLRQTRSRAARDSYFLGEDTISWMNTKSMPDQMMVRARSQTEYPKELNLFDGKFEDD